MGKTSKSTVLFLMSLLSLFISGCNTLKPENIAYNNNKLLFEYQLYPKYKETLRNDSLQIVDSSNIAQFNKELSTKKNRYNWDRVIEDGKIFLKNDFKLAKTFSEINSAIQQENYKNASTLSDQLLKAYPNAKKFTDVHFLKGYSEEQLGNDSVALANYASFMKWSGKRYSEHFRGYRYQNIEDGIFPKERKYASNKLKGVNDSIATSVFKPIVPKHFYESFQPGYRINPDQMDYYRNKDLLYFVFGVDLTNHFNLGVNYYRKVSKKVDFVIGGNTSPFINEYSVALPIQLYQSESNNFGVKITPFANAFWIDSLTINNYTQGIQHWLLNAGAKVSMGYYLSPNFSIGAQYRYNIVNKGNPLNLYNKGISLWIYNEYDISFYYNIYNGFSLKAGIKQNDFVAGFFLSGWEIGYNFNKMGIVLTTSLY